MDCKSFLCQVPGKEIISIFQHPQSIPDRMKFYPIFLFLSLFSAGTIRAAGPGLPRLREYPPYREVCTAFFRDFDTEQLKGEDFYRFRFACRPDGWFVYPESYIQGVPHPTDTIALWKPESGYDRRDSLPASGLSAENELPLYLTNAELYKYSIQPFYGYTGWDTDMIHSYGKFPYSKLTDNELYGTGRAFSQAASDMFWSHGDYSPAKPVAIAPSNRTRRRFIRYARKGIAAFRVLYERNPLFLTMVGTMDVKYHNEIMAKWYELMLFNPGEKADKFLRSFTRRDSLYEDFWNRFAAAMLSIPDSGAVLFTNGDNDTYPLLYAQKQGKIRPDIQIINISLLNDPVYYAAVVNGTAGGSVISAVIPPEDYNRISGMGIYAGPGELTRPLSFANWSRQALDQVTDNRDEVMIARSLYRYVYRLPGGGRDSIEINGDLPNYIPPCLYILPPLISDLFPGRPVFFSKGGVQWVDGLLAPGNLADRVLVYRLNGISETRDDPRYIKVEGSYADTSYIRKLSVNPGMILPDSLHPARQRTYSWLTGDVSFLYELLAPEAGKSETLSLVKDFFLRFPPEQCGISPAHCRMLDLLFRADNGAGGEVTEEISMRFLKILALRENSLEVRDDEINDEYEVRYLAWCISLLTGSDRPGPVEFYKALEKIQEKLERKMTGTVRITTG